VRINRQALDKFGSTLQNRLEKKLGKSGTVVVGTKNAGVKAYGKMVNGVLSDLVDEMYTYSNHMHGNLDTPKNHRLEDAKCNRWVKDVR